MAIRSTESFKLVEKREFGSIWERDNPQGFNDFIVKYHGKITKYLKPPTQEQLNYWRLLPKRICSGACFSFKKIEEAEVFANKTCGSVKEVFTKTILR